ncbi:MAG: undecaprenyl-diphosphate phosphatase [Ferruginibacter sp.]
MDALQTIILSILEGLTEFLPISSTGHMIIASSLMGIDKNEFVKLFEIAVQLGAILAVVVLYWKKFFDFSRIKFYIKLLISVIPALILGKLFSDKIDTLLESPATVAITLLIGGIILLFVDKLFKAPVITEEKNITYRNGL